jgi:hypothetical protein
MVMVRQLGCEWGCESRGVVLASINHSSISEFIQLHAPSRMSISYSMQLDPRCAEE